MPSSELTGCLPYYPRLHCSFQRACYSPERRQRPPITRQGIRVTLPPRQIGCGTSRCVGIQWLRQTATSGQDLYALFVILTLYRPAINNYLHRWTRHSVKVCLRPRHQPLVSVNPHENPPKGCSGRRQGSLPNADPAQCRPDARSHPTPKTPNPSICSDRRPSTFLHPIKT